MIAITGSVRAIDFKKDITPIFEKNCYECHSEKTGKRKAGYVFDDLNTLKLDIQPNGIIVPKSPAESYLMEVITEPDHKRHMPPKGQLSTREIDKLRDWINAGATFGAAEVVEAAPAKKELPPIMTWTNFEGKKIKAGFVRLDGDNVVLKMPLGQQVSYPLSKLDAASQQQARECAAP